MSASSTRLVFVGLDGMFQNFLTASH